MTAADARSDILVLGLSPCLSLAVLTRVRQAVPADDIFRQAAVSLAASAPDGYDALIAAARDNKRRRAIVDLAVDTAADEDPDPAAAAAQFSAGVGDMWQRLNRHGANVVSGMAAAAVEAPSRIRAEIRLPDLEACCPPLLSLSRAVR
jgi:hypothetical protein